MKAIKNFFLFIGQIILLAFLGFLAKECWRIYGEQKKITRVSDTGTRVLVRLDEVSNEKRTWRDQIGNSRYVSFHYQGKVYSMRYSQDSVFLQPGITVPVIYSPVTDEVVQTGQAVRSGQMYKTSHLVRWTVVSLFSGPNIVLFAFVLFAALFLVLGTGYLANLTGILLIRKVGDLLVFICATGGAIYVSYDGVSYWRYYSQLRENGSPETVLIEDTWRWAQINNRSSTNFVFYEYEARVNFQNEPRIIAIAERDYDDLKAGDRLSVLYDRNKDDMMSVNYKLKYRELFFPLVIWAFLLFFYNRRMRAWLNKKN